MSLYRVSKLKASLLPLVTLLLLSCFFASGSIQAQGPPPPPAIDYSPGRWNEYRPENEKFRIRFPQAPQHRIGKQGDLEVHAWEYQGLILYRLSYVDYKTSIEEPQKLKDILNRLKSITLKSVQAKDHRLVSEREVVVDGSHGLFVHLDVQGKEVIRMQWLVVGSRLYTISTLSRKGDPRELEGHDDFEKIALGFINSFHPVP